MFPPGKNLGIPGTGSGHHSRFPCSDPTGPLPLPQGPPGCQMRPYRLPPFQRHRSLGGPHGSNYHQERGEVGTGRGQLRPATASNGLDGGRRKERTLPCPAERAGLRGWGTRMGRPRCGIQGSTQRSRPVIKRVLVPFVTETLALNKPLHTCDLLMGHRTGELSTGSSGELG